MEDTVILKQKKRKVAIDPDQDDEDEAKVVTTKTAEEKAERDNYDHKPNGTKTPEPKKAPEKKDESKASKPDAKPSAASKPKATPEKEAKPIVKKDTDQKPPAKPKPEASAPAKKPENGEVKKKPVEEKKAPPKPPAKKKVEMSEESESDDDSGSDDESESEEDSEDEKPRRKKRPTPVKKERAKPANKKEPEVKRKSKDTLIYDVLKRWWYCMPDWPPVNYDYAPVLREKKLRRVEQKYFRAEPETDAHGFKKVYELGSFPGFFKNSKGENVDLRPKEGCPSYENLKSMGITPLCELLVNALRNQVEGLEASPNCDNFLLKTLKGELARAEKSLEVQKSRSQA